MPTAKKNFEPELELHDLSKMRGTLKCVGGSISDGWNNMLTNQLRQALRLHADPEEAKRQRHATVDALIGMAPRVSSRV